MVFQYPLQVHQRRHGPRGYVNYQAFKPWLRDEFDFRCVFCLWRERWYAVGDTAFSVEHLQAQVAAPHLVWDYNNLVYACCRCNSVKTDAKGVLDPCQSAFDDHLEVLGNGGIRGRTPQGRELIRICKLDQPLLTEARRRLLELFRVLEQSDDPRASELLQHYLGFPENLPQLAECRPPGGNTRPEGITESAFGRLQTGRLPATY